MVLWWSLRIGRFPGSGGCLRIGPVGVGKRPLMEILIGVV